MNTYDVGDLVRTTGVFKDADNVVVDPAAVTFKAKMPNGTVLNYTYGVNGELVKDSVGTYHVDVNATLAGRWRYRFASTGAGQAAGGKNVRRAAIGLGLMRTKRITAPTDYPLTILEARLHLREPEVTKDAELLSFIKSGVEVAENKLGRALVTQTWEAYFNRFPHDGLCSLTRYRPSFIELPYPPLQSVTSITYADSNGVTQTLATSEYVVDTSGLIGRVRLAYGKSWPNTLLDYDGNNVTIRYVAGYANEDDIPENVIHWIKLFVETADKNRGLLHDRTPAMSPIADRLLDRWVVASV